MTWGYECVICLRFFTGETDILVHQAACEEERQRMGATKARWRGGRRSHDDIPTVGVRR